MGGLNLASVPAAATSQGEFRRVAAWLRREADSTWVAGVALVVITGAAALNRSNGPEFVWEAYVALVSAVGLSMVLVALADRRSWAAPAIPIIKIVLMVAAAIIAGWYVLVDGGLVIAALAAIQVLTIAALKLRRERQAGMKPTKLLRSLPLDWLICIAAWTAATHFLFWLAREPRDTPTDGLFASGYSLGAIGKSSSLWVGAVVLVAAVGVPLLLLSRRRTGWFAWAERVAFMVAIVILAWVAFDTYGLFANGLAPYYHWSVFVGPAEMVRQGHWLLWDVPSEYGFLSILAIAWVPVGVWQSLFILNALASLAEGAIVFLVLRRVGGGLVGVAVATALVVAAMFWRAGTHGVSLGPDVLPSTGGYRFIWVVALLAIAANVGLSDLSARARIWHQTLGDCIYVIGVLWSVESAAFCTAVWLPTCALIGWGAAGDGRSRRIVRAAGAAVVPLVLSAAAVGASTVAYLAVLGHAPEFSSLVELSAYTYAGEVVRHGPVWGLILAFIALSMTIVPVIKIHGLAGPTIALIAAWAGLVSTALYFVIEPFLLAAYSTAPIWAMGVATALIAVRRHPVHARLADVILLLTAPLLSVLIIGSFSDRSNVWTRVTADQSNRLEIVRALPRVDDDLQALIRTAGLSSTDRVAYFGCVRPANGMVPLWTSADNKNVTEQQNWLPIDPKDSFGPLSRDRQDTYLARWANRRLGGWLIQCKAPFPLAQADPQIGDLESRVTRTYFPTAELENARWRMTRFQPR